MNNDGYFVLQESAVPTEKKKLEQKVSCLHSSIQQPMLLLVGMEDGGVSLLDMRKGVNHGNITPAHAQSVQASIQFLCLFICCCYRCFWIRE